MGCENNRTVHGTVVTQVVTAQAVPSAASSRLGADVIDLLVNVVTP
jgi:hypothetical protein